MARVKIDIPSQFDFTTSIPVRITDLNYGGHMGNDTILSILHELRVQYLLAKGLKELEFAGTGLIMADVAIEFKAEVFYGESLQGSAIATEFSRIGFDIIYKLEKKSGEGMIPVAYAKTGMVCFDYAAKKISKIPAEALEKLNNKVH